MILSTKHGAQFYTNLINYLEIICIKGKISVAMYTNLYNVNRLDRLLVVFQGRKTKLC